MAEPQIIVGHEGGFHNEDLDFSGTRLEKSKSYRDLSTICVIPTRGKVDIKVVESWWGLMTGMNQKFIRVVIRNMEVGEAYNAAVELILNHPDLQGWKYMLTLEEDNMPPPDGLKKLYESIDGYGAVGGLYWTKGEEGQPMIYGNPVGILNFIPQIPIPNTLQECNGLGMGFTLFDLDVFRNPDYEKPYFKTLQEWDSSQGGKVYTQDLYAFEKIRKLGYKVACDTRVKVGHYDDVNDMVW